MKDSLSKGWRRLRADFQLGLLTLFGVCATFGITPFAVYRFATGDLRTGFLDIGIVVCIVAIVGYAWRTGRTEGPGLLVVVVYTAGCALAATTVGLAGLFWMYPTVMANYFLVSRNRAFVASAVAIALLPVNADAFASSVHMALFAVTVSMVAAFAFIFAHQTQSQRQKLEALASSDALTGAKNRRAMDEELPLAIERFRRSATPAGLLMLDLDHFKRVNDRYGHEAGDQVLMQFSAMLKASVRRTDSLYRFGGEEFLVLLSPSSTNAIRTVAENLRSKVAAGLRCAGEPVTVSIGGAVLGPEDTLTTWMARADAALYNAKKLGRNRVVEAHESPPRPSLDT